VATLIANILQCNLGYNNAVPKRVELILFGDN